MTLLTRRRTEDLRVVVAALVIGCDADADLAELALQDVGTMTGRLHPGRQRIARRAWPGGDIFTPADTLITRVAQPLSRAFVVQFMGQLVLSRHVGRVG